MAQPECSSTSTKYNYRQVGEIDRALKVLRLNGILEDSLPYKSLFSLRGKILKQIGIKFPRVPSLLKLVAGLSPGIIRVWHDAESGFMSEARVKPGATPVYKHVSDDVAIKILKGELTKELEAELMTPDQYLGE